MQSNDIQTIPQDLEREIEVTLTRETYRHRIQYVAQHKGYKLVVKNKGGDGERWIVRPEHSPNGHIVFCRAIRKTATKEGVHPLIAATRQYVNNGTRVKIMSMSSRDGWQHEAPVEAVDVETEDDALLITLRNLETFELELSWSRGKSAPYGRYAIDGYMKDGEEVHIIFWTS